MNSSTAIPEGLELLLRLKDTERALVATMVEGSIVVQALHSLEPNELENSSPVATILSQVIKQQKPLLVLDAEQEALFSTVPQERRKAVRSAICVPIIESSDRMIGILYADNSARAGNFSYADQNKLQAEAQALAPRLAAFLAEQASAAGKPQQKPLATTNHLLVAGGVLCLAMLWFMIGLVTNRPKPAPPPPNRISLERASPPAAVRGFLAMSAMKEFGGVEKLLSPRLLQRWPREKLAAHIQSWLATPGVKNDLSYRRVRTGTGVAVGDSAEVIVDTWELNDTKRESWVFFLIRQDGRWLIDRMETKGTLPVPLGSAGPGTV